VRKRARQHHRQPAAGGTPPAGAMVARTEAAPAASTHQVVPIDDHLLDRARTQWQFGDWDSLARLGADELQQHPDRARLALLAAAGHQQRGDMAAARRMSRLALGWGCSRRMVSQVLIAGVHNTLARAAAADQQGERSQRHFEAAIATVSPGSEARLLVRARIGHQLAQMGLAPADGAPGLPSALPSATPGPAPAAATAADAPWTELVALVKKLQADVASVRRNVEATVRAEALNAVKQLEAFGAIAHYLNSGELMPGLHGWPVSPDFALWLIELLERNRYDLVLEFGSGASTLLMRRVLARQGRSVPQWAFEHLPEFHAQTQALLDQAGFGQAVQLRLTPLQPMAQPDGSTQPFYACEAALAEAAVAMQRPGLRVLVLVDGPPSATGVHARYPALPAVLAHFAAAQLDLLLDDYGRADEKAVAQRWLADLQARRRDATLTEMPLEKGACLLRVHGPGPTFAR